MRNRIFRGWRTVPCAAVLALAAAGPAHPDEHEDGIFDAIVDVYHVGLQDGDTGAIDLIQTCYRTHARPGAGLTSALERCIAQDIAFAYFSNGLCGHAFGEDGAPEFTGYDVSEARIDRALGAAGLKPAEHVEDMNRIGSIAFRSALPALEKAKAGTER